MEKLRVLVADDTIVYRKIVAEAVETTGLGTVVHTASNGAIAVDWVKQGNIDVVLLDVFMPEMDGLEALKIIKKGFPHIEVIMISSGGSDSAQTTLEALEYGAIDFVMKPSESSMDKNLERIKNQLQMLFTQIQIKKYSSPSVPDQAAKIVKPIFNTIQEKAQKTEQKISIIKRPWTGADLVVIASSTGGPNALEMIFNGFGAGFQKPILIVQHMPPDFTKMLAQSLNKNSSLNVFEGQTGDKVKDRDVIIAPGGFHMVVEASDNSSKAVRMESTPYVNGVRPSADVLFRSVAKEYAGKNILAVVLTGMGNDGMQGVAEIKKSCNCYCVTQSEASSVVYGMPRCVFDAGLSDEVADLKDIAERIRNIASGRS